MVLSDGRTSRTVLQCMKAVPQRNDSWAGGYYISDWAEDVLQLSSNECLGSCCILGRFAIFLQSSPFFLHESFWARHLLQASQFRSGTRHCGSCETRQRR